MMTQPLWKRMIPMTVFCSILWQLLLLIGLLRFQQPPQQRGGGGDDYSDFDNHQTLLLLQRQSVIVVNESVASSSLSSLLRATTTTTNTVTTQTPIESSQVQTIERKTRGKSSSSSSSHKLIQEDHSLTTLPESATFQQQQENESKTDTTFLPIQRLQKHIDDNRRPFFILHAGVPKTATTTLQLGLWNLRQELRHDGYVHVGMMGQHYEPASFDALINPTCQQALTSYYWDDNKQQQTSKSLVPPSPPPPPPPPCWSAFLQDLEKLRQQGRHVIVSDERFSELWKPFDKKSGPGRFHWRAVKEALQPFWNVQVVLSYRRLYEWLPSTKLQFDKMTGRTKQWPSSSSMHSGGGGGGGSTLSGMYPQLDHLLTFGTGRYKNIEQALAQYQRHFSKNAVTIWNMAAPAQRDVVPTFVCDFLWNATTACEKLLLTRPKPNDDDDKNETINTSSNSGTGSSSNIGRRANVAQNYDYDRIAVEAAAMNFFNISTLTRGFVTRQLRHFHETFLGLRNDDLPQSCPSQEQMERLLKASLAMEERVLPSFHHHDSALGKVAHVANFWQAVQSGKKYCSVDPGAVIANATYRSFLMGLDPQYKQQRQPQ